MTASEETTAAARAFLSDHPEAEAALTALLERDSKGEPWTFAEVELDSGLFGELVSRGLATSVDDGYRLQHPDAIRTALVTHTEAAVEADSEGPTSTKPPSDSSPSDAAHDGLTELIQPTGVDPVTATGLIGALLAVAAARLVAAPAVFRDGFVVSPANDTYFFRYWQERLAARANGILDLGLFAEMGGAASTRPLAHATNWWITVLLGGVDAAPIVAAWLPVVASVCLGYLIYRLTQLLTNDVRVAVAAVLFYGLAPVNVVYTSVGFLDHQAHQYLWLGLLVVTLTALGVDIGRRADRPDDASAAWAHARDLRMWVIAGGLAVAVAASAHAWGGSPLTFIPVAAIVGFRVALDVHHDMSPALSNAPLLGGLGLGSGLALVAHLALGWHEPIAAITPVLVAGGGFVVAMLGELWRRAELRPLGLMTVEVVVAVGGLIGYVRLRPKEVNRIRARAGDLFFREGISETASLFSPDFAVVFGPLLQLGLGFYFAIAVLPVVTWVLARRYEPGWLVPICFAWFYILLATIQVRFAGQLAIVIAPFAGIGLVYLLAAIDVARPVTVLDWSGVSDFQSTRVRGDNQAANKRAITSLALPDSNSARGYLAAAVALVLLFNVLLVPSLVGQTTHDRAQFDAAQTVNAHAEAVEREYPQNFVLSQWGNNRMYNYFVSGESRSYGYARANHDSFLAAPDPDAQYDRFQDRVGYVVITERERTPTTNSTYTVLHEGLGIGINGTSPVGHYQLLTADNGVRTFALVPGATIRVTDSAAVATDGQVTATTEVEVGGESRRTTHEYARTAVMANGAATIRVAHPGEYRVGNTTVTVTDDAVLTGNQTTLSA